MKIKIGTRNYTVSFPDTIAPSSITRGRISYTEATIKVARKAGMPPRKLSEMRMYNAMWHEFVHGILADMGSRKERDEKFVDELAKRIVQIERQLWQKSKQ